MKSNKFRLILFLILFTAGTGLTVYGLIAGGYADVFNKAVRICNECIGIG